MTRHPPIRRGAATLTSFAAPDQLVIAMRGSILDADKGSMFRAD